MRVREGFLAATAIVGLLAIAVAPTPAMACSGPTPTLDDAVRTADAIYLGDVVWTPTGSRTGIPRTAFDLDVERSMRGPDRETVKVRGLRGSSCLGSIAATTGDRVLLATGIDWEPRYLAGIWQVDDAGMVKTEAGPVKLTAVLASVSAAPDTSTAPAATGSDGRQVPILELIGLTALFLATLGWRLRATRPRARRSG